MTDEDLHRLLSSNNYFEHPKLWVDIARAHDFRPVVSTRLLACPDCGSASFAPIGQYIHYSSLIRLQRCRECDLIFSDVLLAPEVIAQHFEVQYKDESYFLTQRQPIFAEIAARVASILPPGGSVLDVGGAKGHLATEIHKRRPDARIVVNDISSASCDHARDTLGFETICGDLPVLSGVSERFDVVLGIDVAYYEPRLRTAWSTFAALTAPRGTLILRIPNRLYWIQAAEAWNRLMRRCGLRRGPQVTVASFNSEHIYIFTRRYLKRTLNAHGFDTVQHLPSRFLASNGTAGSVRGLLYAAIIGASRLTGGAVVLSSSQLVVATRSA